jgi:Fe-coproporphyrin III synthase
VRGRPPVPESLPLVTLNLGERCSSRCVTCDSGRHGARDVTLAAVERMLPALEALGTRTVVLSGGEPLQNREWHQIASLLRACGIGRWLLTSGLSLAKHAPRAVDLFDAITVSLDGTRAHTYAEIRGLDAFDQVCAGVRAVAAAGRPAGLRVTLQRANFRELPRFIALAHDLGAANVSFVAVDTSNAHAFARSAGAALDLALTARDLPVLDRLLARLEREHADDFRMGFIAEPPAKLRRMRDYFAALLGQRAFPAVRCNAPEFSAVIDAEGRVAPCLFIAGPKEAPLAPRLAEALDHEAMRALRVAIRDRRRSECERCVCSVWREPEALAEPAFAPQVAADA